MNHTLFVYRRESPVQKPYPAKITSLVERAREVVVAIVGSYNSFVSGLHLGQREVVTYHREDFHPKEVIVNDSMSVPIEKVIGRKENYHTYRVVVFPNIGLLEVSGVIRSEEFVFEVGVRNNAPATVSFGVVEPILRHVDGDKVENPEINPSSESGSGVFNYEGRLIGMTLGHISPDIMAATSISNLLNIGKN